MRPRNSSRRTIQLLRDLLAIDPVRLILIDAPPLSRPERQALLLFAGQVVLVVAAGRTRGAVSTALRARASEPTWICS